MTAGTARGGRPPKPKAPPFTGLPDFEALRELRQHSQWVSWDYVWKEKISKWDKPPFDPKTGQFGSVKDPATWSDYDAAARRTKQDGLAGVGFALAPDGNISGIDLDKCRDPATGALQHWAQVAVDFGETYAEVSPSGTGLRFFVVGLVDGRKIDAAQVEIYTEGRYLTVTGEHVDGTPTEIRPAPRLVAYLQERADQFGAAQRLASELAREQERKKAEKQAEAQAQEPPRQTTSERASANARERGPRDGSDFWRAVNDRALANLGAWVTSVFPSARYQSGTGAYRVDQCELGEGYEEDLSLHPDGIRDFGVGDMGDAREGRRSAIDIVRDYLPASDAAEAALWLCQKIGITPEELGWRSARSEKTEAPRGSNGTAEQGQRRERDEPREPPLHWHRDVSEIAERAWLIRDMVPEIGKGLLAGQWGSAKTFLSLDLSASVMTGEPFAGRRVLRRGGVLFVAPEGAYEIPIRLRGLVAGKIAGVAMAQAASGEEAVDPNDLPFAWIEECPRLVVDGAADALIATARVAERELRERYNLPLALIIVDTVAAGAGFNDENSAAETQKAMNALEQLGQATGAFVLGVDHFGKAIETGTRGSSAKEAAADTVLAALATKDEAGNVSNMRLAVRKVRGAQAGREIPYGLETVEIGRDRYDEPVTTCVIAWQTERDSEARTEKPKDKWSTGLRVFREAIVTSLDEHAIRAWPYGAQAGEQRAVPVERVRAAGYSIYPASAETEAQRAETKRKQFNRMLSQAQGKDLVGSIELSGVDHLWLKPAGQEGEQATHAGRTGHL